jgi:hypothetical protein
MYLYFFETKYNIYSFVITFLSDNINIMISIDESSIHFIGKNCWRSNIRSILSTEGKDYYLVKECRSELIGEHPFSHPGRYEVLEIIEGDKVHFIRTPVIGDNIENHQLDQNQLKIKKYIVEKNVNYLSFQKVHEITLSDKTKNIYCEIEYEYEAIKYSLISRCEYINYNNEKNRDKYLQPIMGYVPFILKKQLRYGYAVFYVKENTKGFLEFLLSQKTNIFDTESKQNLIKLLIKKFLNMLLFSIKINNFKKLITIKKYKVKFFQYT